MSAIPMETSDLSGIDDLIPPEPGDGGDAQNTLPSKPQEGSVKSGSVSTEEKLHSDNDGNDGDLQENVDFFITLNTASSTDAESESDALLAASDDIHVEHDSSDAQGRAGKQGAGDDDQRGDNCDNNNRSNEELGDIAMDTDLVDDVTVTMVNSIECDTQIGDTSHTIVGNVNEDVELGSSAGHMSTDVAIDSIPDLHESDNDCTPIESPSITVNTNLIGCSNGSTQDAVSSTSNKDNADKQTCINDATSSGSSDVLVSDVDNCTDSGSVCTTKDLCASVIDPVDVLGEHTITDDCDTVRSTDGDNDVMLVDEGSSASRDHSVNTGNIVNESDDKSNDGTCIAGHESGYVEDDCIKNSNIANIESHSVNDESTCSSSTNKVSTVDADEQDDKDINAHISDDIDKMNSFATCIRNEKDQVTATDMSKNIEVNIPESSDDVAAASSSSVDTKTNEISGHRGCESETEQLVNALSGQLIDLGDYDSSIEIMDDRMAMRYSHNKEELERKKLQQASEEALVKHQSALDERNPDLIESPDANSQFDALHANVGSTCRSIPDNNVIKLSNFVHVVKRTDPMSNEEHEMTSEKGDNTAAFMKYSNFVSILGGSNGKVQKVTSLKRPHYQGHESLPEKKQKIDKGTGMWMQYSKFMNGSNNNLTNGSPPSTSVVAPESLSLITSTMSTANNTDKLVVDISSTTSSVLSDLVQPITVMDVLSNPKNGKPYVPPPIPAHLRSYVANRVFKCLACSDAFRLESSLKTHCARRSMNIYFECSYCKAKLLFYNKCLLYLHIGSHCTNKHDTDAVLQSSEVSIKPLSEVQLKNISAFIQPHKLEARELKSNTTTVQESAIPILPKTWMCSECGQIFKTSHSLALHFGIAEMICSFLYCCNICKMYLPKSCALQAHSRMHTGQPPFTCPECGQSFGTGADLESHTEHDCHHFSRVTKFTCTVCGEIKTDWIKLKDHIFERHGEFYLKCVVCPMAFKTQAGYNSHWEKRHSSPISAPNCIFKCPLCATVYSNKDQLDDHFTVHIQDMRKNAAFAFKCTDCQKFFHHRGAMIKHWNQKKVGYSCRVCCSGFPSSKMLTAHMSTNHPDGSYTVTPGPLVPLAPKVLSPNHTNLALYRNPQIGQEKKAPLVIKKKVHVLSPKIKPMEKQLDCDICGASFTKRKPFLKHSLRIHGIKLTRSSCLAKFDCFICSSQLEGLAGYISHLKSHHKDGLYPCTRCRAESFKDLGDLQNHEAICMHRKHEKSPTAKQKTSPMFNKISSPKQVTPPIYPTVDKPAFLTAALKPQICDLCQLGFPTQEALLAHKTSTHPDVLTYPCHLCGLTYRSPDTLTSHIAIVHEGRPYRALVHCPVCRKKGIKKGFQSQATLDKHLAAKHRNSSYENNEAVTLIETCNIKQEVDDDYSNANSPKDSQDMVNTPIKRLRNADDSVYTCVKCSFSCEDQSVFHEHIHSHKTERDSVQCQECGLCFAVFPSLKKHLFMVHKVREFSKYIPDVVQAETHPDSDSDDSTVDISAFQNGNKSVMVKVHPHIPRSTPVQMTYKREYSEPAVESNNPLECKVCYKEFQLEVQLRTHMRTHGMAFIRSKRSGSNSSSLND